MGNPFLVNIHELLNLDIENVMDKWSEKLFALWNTLGKDQYRNYQVNHYFQQ